MIEVNQPLQSKVIFELGVSIAQWLAHLILDPAAPGSIPSAPKKFSEENKLPLLMLIKGLSRRKVDSGLKMLIEPI